MSGNFSEVIERSHKQLTSLAKALFPSFRKLPDRQSRPSAFKTSANFNIVRIEF